MTTNWPSLKVSDWTSTRDTLHMWTQIVGKIRMAHAPLVGPEGAYFSSRFQQFLLPYEVARAAPDPDRAVAEFLRTTYETAANLGHWDRPALEDNPFRWQQQAPAVSPRPI